VGILGKARRAMLIVLAVTGCARVHSRDLEGDVPTGTAVPIHGVLRTAGLGTAIACAGDLTGDGIPDLAVSAPRMATGVDGAGAVYVFAGPVDGTLELGSAVAVLYGETAEDQAGISLSSSGDLNGDGRADLVVGSWAAGGEERGAAYVVFGPIAGEQSLSDADVALYGGEPGDHGGFALASGDVDGDGNDDLAVSSFHAERGGSVYLFFGPIARGDRPLSSSDTRIGAARPDDHVGISLASGDLTGDGIDDLVVGAPLSDGGTVHVVSLPTRGTIAIADAAAHLVGVGTEEAGSSVTVGDVTGDGVADLVVGAPGAEAAPGTVGGIYVVPGPIAGTHALSSFDTIVGEAPIDGFGVSVAAGFDRDADGIGDLLVGAWGLDVATEGEGAGYFFYGRPRAGVGRDTGVRLLGEGEGARAGMAVAACEGWGRATLVVGAPGTDEGAGAVFLFP
jgi:hypothetical protein